MFGNQVFVYGEDMFVSPNKKKMFLLIRKMYDILFDEENLRNPVNRSTLSDVLFIVQFVMDFMCQKVS